jgi:hypothetical protein
MASDRKRRTDADANRHADSDADAGSDRAPI